MRERERERNFITSSTSTYRRSSRGNKNSIFIPPGSSYYALKIAQEKTPKALGVSDVAAGRERVAHCGYASTTMNAIVGDPATLAAKRCVRAHGRAQCRRRGAGVAVLAVGHAVDGEVHDLDRPRHDDRFAATEHLPEVGERCPASPVIRVVVWTTLRLTAVTERHDRHRFRGRPPGQLGASLVGGSWLRHSLSTSASLATAPAGQHRSRRPRWHKRKFVSRTSRIELQSSMTDGWAFMYSETT